MPKLVALSPLYLFHWEADAVGFRVPLYALGVDDAIEQVKALNDGELPSGFSLYHNGALINSDCAKTRKQSVTDRAKRYRANQPGCLPPGPRVCSFCGASDDVMVHHLDGDEDNGDRANLAYACRSCNTRIANQHKAIGAGRRNDQYNAGRKRRRIDFSQFAAAVASIGAAKGYGDAQMDLFEAREILRAMTPAEKSAYQKEVWRIRKERYGESGRKDGGAVPF